MLLASDGRAMTPAAASSTTNSRMALWWRAACPTKLIGPRRRGRLPFGWRRRRGRGAVGERVLAAHHHRFAGRDAGEDLRLAAGDDAHPDPPPVRLGLGVD